MLEEVITFDAFNTMTEETAFGLLHLLHHLRDTAYHYTDGGLLNGRLLDLLSGVDGDNGVTVQPYRFKCEEIAGFNLPTLAQLEEWSRQIRFKKVLAREEIHDLETGLNDTLQLCVGAGQLCREVAFDIGTGPEICFGAVNSIIEVSLRNYRLR